MPERYGKVYSRIWREQWDDDMKFVAIFLLTTDHGCTEGLYRFAMAYGAADLGWPDKRFAQAFDALIRVGFIEYDEDARVVLIRKALKTQAPENPNQVKYALKSLRALPPTRLMPVFLAAAAEHAPRFAGWLREQSPELFSEPTSNGHANGSGNGLLNSSLKGHRTRSPKRPPRASETVPGTDPETSNSNSNSQLLTAVDAGSATLVRGAPEAVVASPCASAPPTATARGTI